MSTHSPGPWTVLDAFAGEAVYSAPIAESSARRPRQSRIGDYPVEGLVALVYGHHDATGNYSAEANQRLIAAAPELLKFAKAFEQLITAAPELLKFAKAFEQLITKDSDDLGFHLKLAAACVEDVRGLRAAIAKAEGKS